MSQHFNHQINVKFENLRIYWRIYQCALIWYAPIRFRGSRGSRIVVTWPRSAQLSCAPVHQKLSIIFTNEYSNNNLTSMSNLSCRRSQEIKNVIVVYPIMLGRQDNRWLVVVATHVFMSVNSTNPHIVAHFLNSSECIQVHCLNKLIWYHFTSYS